MEPWQRTNAATKIWSSAGSWAPAGEARSAPSMRDVLAGQPDALDFEGGAGGQPGERLPVLSGHS